MANPKIIPRYTTMTPYEIYLQQVRGTFDGLRANNSGQNYIPPQFGGVFGQQALLQSGSVLELIDFEVD